TERIVHDRIKNYLSKYLLTAQEVTERDVLATGAKPGTPKFQKAREELILTRLDARPKKIPLPEEVPAPGPGGPGRPSGGFGGGPRQAQGGPNRAPQQSPGRPDRGPGRPAQAPAVARKSM